MYKKKLTGFLAFTLISGLLEIHTQVARSITNSPFLRENKLIALSFKWPRISRPGIARGPRRGAGTFGPCSQPKDGNNQSYNHLLALVPKYRDNSTNNTGKPQVQPDKSQENSKSIVYTIDENPSFWFYTPYTAQASGSNTIKAIGELTITRVVAINDSEKNYEKISETLFPLPEQPGLISVKPKYEKGESLKINEDYYWKLKIYCNLQQDSPSDSVGGTIIRLNRTPEIEQQLAAAKGKEYTVYANNGYWYDTLTSLESIKTKTQSPKLNEEWIELLQLNDLEDVAKQPVVEHY